MILSPIPTSNSKAGQSNDQWQRRCTISTPSSSQSWQRVVATPNDPSFLFVFQYLHTKSTHLPSFNLFLFLSTTGIRPLYKCLVRVFVFFLLHQTMHTASPNRKRLFSSDRVEGLCKNITLKWMMIWLGLRSILIRHFYAFVSYSV